MHFRLALVARDSFPRHASISFAERCTRAPGRGSLLLWCQSSQVSVTARLERRSDSSVRCELRRTPLRFVRLLCCSPAPHGAYLASRVALPRGSAWSRESFTQDSRSAVKARRYFRSVTRIIRRGALHASRQKTWRPRERPSRGFRALIMRRKPVDSRADRGMRAYVTGSDDARSAMRAGYRLAPRRVASSRLAAHERREGRCARTARRRRFSG